MSKTHKIASVYDTALDEMAMGKDGLEYAKSRDESLLKWKKDARPTWFHLKRIGVNSFQKYVAAAPTESERNRRAFLMSVTRIDCLVDMDGDFHEALVPTGMERGASGPVAYFTDEEMDLIPPSFIEDVGHFAHGLSFLAPAARDFYQPPRSSLMVWAARLTSVLREEVQAARSRSASSLPADETPSEPGPSSDAPSDAG